MKVSSCGVEPRATFESIPIGTGFRQSVWPDSQVAIKTTEAGYHKLSDIQLKPIAYVGLSYSHRETIDIEVVDVQVIWSPFERKI